MSVNLAPGWLADQLPRALATDDFTRRFVGIFEEIGGDLRQRVDAMGSKLDPGVAPSEHLRWLASWFGRLLDDAVPEEQQRVAVHLAGPSLPWRSTRRGLRLLVESYIGAPAAVTDNGGVYLRGEWRPRPAVVRVVVPHTGGLTRDALADLIRGDLPVGAKLELVVGAPPPEAPDAPLTADVHSAGPSLAMMDLDVMPAVGRTAVGTSITCGLRLRNLGTQWHSFRPVVLGIPTQWWWASLLTVDVPADGAVEFEVRIDVPDYVDPDELPTLSFDVGVRGSGGSTFATVRIGLDRS